MASWSKDLMGVALFVAVILLIWCMYKALYWCGYWFVSSIRWHKPSRSQNRSEWGLPEHEYQKLMEDLGPIYGKYIGCRKLITISDIGLLKTHLVKDEIGPTKAMEPEYVLNYTMERLTGEDRERVKGVVQAAFSRRKITKLMPKLLRCANKTLSCFNPENRVGDFSVVNVDSITYNYVSSLIIYAIFGAEENSEEEREIRSQCDKERRSAPSFSWFKTNFYGMYQTKYQPLDSDVVNYFIRLVHQIFIRRRDLDVEQRPVDFIGIIMEILEDEDLHRRSPRQEPEHANGESPDASPTAAMYLSTQEIAAFGIHFLLEKDSIMSVLAHSIQKLSEHERFQAAVYSEIMSVMDDDEPITYELLEELKHLDAFILEVIRVLPPRVKLQRKVLKRYKLENTIDEMRYPVKLAKGSFLEVPIYSIHTSKDFADDAEVFNPGRFLDDQVELAVPEKFLGFGLKPKSCAAQKFVIVVIKLAIVKILREYELLNITSSIEYLSEDEALQYKHRIRMKNGTRLVMENVHVAFRSRRELDLEEE